MSIKANFYYIKYAIFLLLLYCYIYSPPLQVFPVLPKYFLYLLIFIPLLTSKNYLKQVRQFRVHFSLFFLLVLYSFCREMMALKLLFFPINLMLFIEASFLPLFFIYYYKNIKPEGDLFKEIIVVGSIASFFTVLMIIYTPLSDFVRYNLLRTSEFTEGIAFRTFGFAEGLTYSYGIIQGLILSLVIIYSGKDSKYLLLVPFLFISILFNARTGFVPVVITIFVLNLLNFRFRRVLGIVFGAIFIYLFYNNTNYFEEYKVTIEWGLDFFTQSSNFLTDSSSSKHNTFDTLFGEMAVFPNTFFGWLFGYAQDLFVSKTNNSDVGYIIQLYYGGIIYMGLIVMIILNMARYFFYFKSQKRQIILILFLTVVLINVKGNFFTPIGVLRLIMLIFFLLIIEGNKSQIITKKDAND